MAKLLDTKQENIRVLFSPRDSENRFQMRYFEFNINKPRDVLRVSDYPLLTLGKLGSFDDAVLTLVSIVNGNGKELFIFYWLEPYCQCDF